MKSTVNEIRARFDADVERFSNLDSGQVAAMDSPLHMTLVAQAAAVVNPQPQRVLDIGCGAGNYTLKLLQHYAAMHVDFPCVDLIDLSQPMLDRALQRIGEFSDQPIRAMQGDVRELDLGREQYDIVLAAQSLHHLRTDEEWRDVFTRIHRALRPSGSFWIADQVLFSHPAINQLLMDQWGDYLVSVKGEAYRDEVFFYVEKEDTPRPLGWQMDLMRQVGFEQVDVLHKRSKFASFGGVKTATEHPVADPPAR